jgi:tetratricopeptide (TPR) repeat protein
MVADFLLRKRPEVVAETGGRLEKRAYELIVENGYKRYDRFPVLDEAWPTVAPALPLFIDGTNAQLQTVCSALTNFLHFTGRWDEQLSLEQQAEARAVAASDHNHAGWRAFQVGMVHYLRRQRVYTVLACADRAASHWDTAQAGTRERATAIRLRGLGHELQVDYAGAIAAFREELDLHRTLSSESRDVSNALNDLASAEERSGDPSAAERDYREALRIALAVGYSEGVAYITGNLAGLALSREDWVEAETLAREALLLSDKVGRNDAIALDCHRLAKALLYQGKRKAALPHARRALRIYTHLASPYIEAARYTLEQCEPSVR